MGLLYTHSYYVEPSTIPWDWEDNVVISLVYGGDTRGIGSYLTARSWSKNLEPVPLACVTQNLPWQGTPSATEPFSPPLLASTSCFVIFFLLQHHPRPPPVPLRDCWGPVQILRLRQCAGAGRRLHELCCHPARDPGPPEGAPGLS